ncbi:DegT/DnrJ/EryC1/StrS family aminotransferase [Candidatus Pseudothioglobus singularis]|nr:DegT/DnrJ/EryC1/StrS family aminotransferase [Candidatus Pseudothioglobus singularis]
MSIKDPHGKFNGKELEYLSSFLDSEGTENKVPWVQLFEETVAKKLGTKYAVACNSGTSGLHMAMFACGIGPGDEVITPGLTVVMDAYSVIHVGAKPIFVDVDRSTYGIDVSEIKKKITNKTKAIITVSLQGLSVDMDPILKVAKEHNLIVIDDSAQNILGEYKGRVAGTLGDMSMLSFENKKHITAGSEGGMLLTDNEEFAIKARKFGGIGYKHMTASAGRTSLALSDVQNPDYERFDTIGLNYRMSEVSAAVGLAQFERIDAIVERRIAVANIFLKAVQNVEWIVPQFIPKNYKHSHYTFSFEYKGSELLGISWKEFYNMYVERGGDGFYSACVVPYLEPVFQEHECYKEIYKKGMCPIAEDLQKKIMQFKTNYRSLEDAQNKANILKELIYKIESNK